MKRLIWLVGVCALLSSAAMRLAAADPDAAGAKKTVEKGGEFWSSPADFVSGDTTISPGTRLLFWPDQDQVHDALRKKVTLRFHWALMSGEKQFKKGQALKLTVLTASDPDFVASATVQPAAEADEGVVSATLPLEKCDCSGDTDLILFLGLKDPQSNLLKVRVRFERLTKTPRPLTR